MATTVKYDRQLRLWGINGQQALGDTCVVLVNSTAVGTETLKNLVLPGIGSFHVIDERSEENDNAVTGINSSNFFSVVNDEKKIEDAATDAPPKTKSRCQVVCDQLCELNPDVKGTWEEVSSLMDLNYKIFIETMISKSTKLLVIGADLPLKPLYKLSEVCFNHKIPFLSVKSYGFIGTCRIVSNYHNIVESKPDNVVADLRLGSFLSKKYVFKELDELVASIDLTTLDDKDHQHVPYVVLLIKAMRQWQQENNAGLPKTLDEKNSFKILVKQMSRHFAMELNFEEAFRDAYLAYTSKEVPYEVQELVDNMSLEIVESSFDVMVMALQTFLKNSGGEPPLDGSIPDMTSSTELYVTLQTLYKTRADQDFQTMKSHVEDILKQLPSTTNITVSDDELATFCKNVCNIQVYRTRTMNDELNMQYPNLFPSSSSDQTHPCDVEEVRDELKMISWEPNADPPVHTPLLWYMATRGCEIYQYLHGQYPGQDVSNLEIEVNQVHELVCQMLSNMKLNEMDLELFQTHLITSKDIIKQQVLCYNAELHNIASMMGGIASQEAVKLITHQYIPLQNTIVLNGLASIASVYQF